MSKIREILNELATELEKIYPDLLDVGVPDLSPTEETKKWLLYPVISITKVAYQNNAGGLKLPLYLVGFQEGTFRTYQSDAYGGLKNRGKNVYDRSDIILIGKAKKEELVARLVDKVTGEGGMLPDSFAYIIPN